MKLYKGVKIRLIRDRLRIILIRFSVVKVIFLLFTTVSSSCNIKL